MSDEARVWLRYAREYFRAAELCLESALLNPCLQNAQQAVEKALKALCLTAGLPLKKTHSISELRGDLLGQGVDVGLAEEDAELLDSIYLPSKYPLGSALPNFEPDVGMARRCLSIADRILAEVNRIMKSK